MNHDALGQKSRRFPLSSSLMAGALAVDAGLDHQQIDDDGGKVSQASQQQLYVFHLFNIARHSAFYIFFFESNFEPLANRLFQNRMLSWVSDTIISPFSGLSAAGLPLFVWPANDILAIA
jgi:hypothetical protein